jgi:hypothetical protein
MIRANERIPEATPSQPAHAGTARLCSPASDRDDHGRGAGPPVTKRNDPGRSGEHPGELGEPAGRIQYQLLGISRTVRRIYGRPPISNREPS